ncbi:MAG: hypothetical protein LBN08_00275 [Lactobacillales bacterium]|jgi:hypothetical protein|nr:hypothetical protein [Lactobacillales bacterium]
MSKKNPMAPEAKRVAWFAELAVGGVIALSTIANVVAIGVMSTLGNRGKK